MNIDDELDQYLQSKKREELKTDLRFDKSLEINKKYAKMATDNGMMHNGICFFDFKQDFLEEDIIVHLTAAYKIAMLYIEKNGINPKYIASFTKRVYERAVNELNKRIERIRKK